LPKTVHPWVDGQTGPLDDAAVVRPEGAARSLVLTIDVITPIVDDPRAFGEIAAANAMSDVYAMGGGAELALAFVGFPSDKLPLEVLGEILAGLGDAAARGRCTIVGGHTISDMEPKAGLAVVGSVDPRFVWSHRSAREGQALVLTKALGTGVVGQAVRAGVADPAMVQRAIAQMTRLNDRACEVGREVGATSCTDVTGFGLLGHLRNILEASGLSAVVSAGAVPFIEGAPELVRSGLVPGGSKRNLARAEEITDFTATIDDAIRLLLSDAQTSGGLLLTVPETRLGEALARLHDAGDVTSRAIGALRRDGAPRIRVEA
jgi:selenide, water dikinase